MRFISIIWNYKTTRALSTRALFNLTFEVQINKIIVTVRVHAGGCPRSEDIILAIRICRFLCVANSVQWLSMKGVRE
jgi:hypothetical protein